MYSIIVSNQIFLNPKSATILNNGSFYSDLRFDIPKLIKNNNNVIYNTIKLSHAEIPYSFYVINSYNNKLILDIGEILIAEGNYNSNEFITYIADNYSNLVTVTFSKLTGKLKLASTQNFSVLGSSTIGDILGFKNGFTYISNNNSLTLPYPCNFLGPKNLFIKINNLILGNYDTNSKTENTLSNIPVNVPPFGFISYDNDNVDGNLIENHNVDYLEILITDENNNLINFNNVEWNLTLNINSNIEIMKNENTITEHLTKMRNM